MIVGPSFMHHARKLLKWPNFPWFFFLIFILFAATSASGQGKVPHIKISNYTAIADSLEIQDIIIIGNRTTKDQIILRELSFQVGSKIPTRNLPDFLELERNKIFNTDLFVTTEMTLASLNIGKAAIVIEVIERWFLVALPLVDFADRNFNEWWRDRNRDLRRLEYGIKFKDRNFRGRKEYLKFDMLLGFTQNAFFQYEIPFLDKKQKTGLSLGAGISQNRDVAFRTFENKLDFASSNEVLIRRYSARLGMVRRAQFYNFHQFNLEFKYNLISDTIAMLNPDYFMAGRTEQRFFELNYTFTRDKRDVAAYPLKGYMSRFLAVKRGLGIYDDLDLWIFRGMYSKYYRLGKQVFMASSLSGKFSWPEVQPYNQFQNLGYSRDFITGYDLYVIDGQANVAFKNVIRWRMLSGKQELSKFVPFRQFSTIPYAIFLKMHFDGGYARNTLADPKIDFLSNKWLGGAALGLDIVTFYNAVFRLEYSRNGLGEGNFFVYFTGSL